MNWQPIPKTYHWHRYAEPVVSVGRSGKGQMSRVAEELLGTPDGVVLLRNGTSYGLRAAVAGDDPQNVRVLDPGGSIQLGLKPGHYILKGEGPEFQLTRIKAASLSRQPIVRTVR